MLLKDLYYMTQIAGCGSLSRAARQLGLSRQNVQYYLKKFGLNQEE